MMPLLLVVFVGGFRRWVIVPHVEGRITLVDGSWPLWAGILVLEVSLERRVPHAALELIVHADSFPLRPRSCGPICISYISIYVKSSVSY